MRLTTPHGISSPPFRFQGELCLWLLKKCYPCLRYTCYLCLQSIHSPRRGGGGRKASYQAFQQRGFEATLDNYVSNPTALVCTDYSTPRSASVCRCSSNWVVWLVLTVSPRPDIGP